MATAKKEKLSGIGKEVETLKARLEELKERLQSVYEDEDEAFQARTDRDSIEYEAAEEICNDLYQAEYYVGTSLGDLETALEYIDSAIAAVQP